MGVNRALRRAAARKAFKQDVKMSDLDKTFCNIAKEEATNKLITSITFTMQIIGDDDYAGRKQRA